MRSSPEPEPGPSAHAHEAGRGPLLPLALGALGVVYGDIGTSPLYAVRECFHPLHGVPLEPANVLGVLSLVFWSLFLVVVVKYLTFVMRADNHGDGGILALLALVGRNAGKVLVGLGLFGAALLWADGVITPAISVLGAVEGLEVATPVFKPFVVPIAVVVLAALFLVQKRGTGGIGAVFGPIMTLWFVTIAALGVPWIVREPRVLAAVNPMWGLRLLTDGHGGFLILGSVVLCITGAEALYADMGHFGRRPIRWAWYALVFPSLILNYLGQGALLLAGVPGAAENPFYRLAPPMLVYPLVGLATAAAVIASQALISGAFSLAQQAVQLGYSPRLTIVHTSGTTRGQIYAPGVNTALMIACIGLVLAFGHSTHLAAAYGIAVVGTMATTSFLLFAVARSKWGWGIALATLLVGGFLVVDLAFLAANMTKLLHGGWFPLLVGLVLFTVMKTWKDGRVTLERRLIKESMGVDLFMKQLPAANPIRVPGTAVFMTSNLDVVPAVLLHHYKHNKVLHRTVLLLSVLTEGVPTVAEEAKADVRDLGQGFYQVVSRWGYMEAPDISVILRFLEPYGITTATDQTSFYLGRVTLLRSGPARLPRWRKALFSVLSRNARPATAFFGIPPNRVIELGTQIEL